MDLGTVLHAIHPLRTFFIVSEFTSPNLPPPVTFPPVAEPVEARLLSLSKPGLLSPSKQKKGGQKRPPGSLFYHIRVRGFWVR